MNSHGIFRGAFYMIIRNGPAFFILNPVVSRFQNAVFFLYKYKVYLIYFFPINLVALL